MNDDQQIRRRLKMHTPGVVTAAGSIDNTRVPRGGGEPPAQPESVTTTASCLVCGKKHGALPCLGLLEPSEQPATAQPEVAALRARAEELETMIASPLKSWAPDEVWPRLMRVVSTLLATDDGKIVFKAWAQLEDGAKSEKLARQAAERRAEELTALVESRRLDTNTLIDTAYHEGWWNQRQNQRETPAYDWHNSDARKALLAGAERKAAT